MSIIDLLNKLQKPELDDGSNFFMVSNFDKNAVVMKITNIDTDIRAARNIRMRSSVLHDTPRINEIIKQTSDELQSVVSKLNVTPEIGSLQFIPMNTNTFLPMQNVASCYAILPAMFNRYTLYTILQKFSTN